MATLGPTREAASADRRLAALRAITFLINSAGLTGDTFQRIAAEMRPLLPFDMAALALLDERTGYFELCHEDNRGALPIAEPLRFPRHHSAYGWVIDHRKPLLLPDIREAPHFVEHATLLELGVRSRVVAPLVAGNERLGALGFGARQPHAFTEADAEFAAIVADEIGIALQNRRLLEQAARLDALEEADRMRSLLLSTVSHELRTPLGLVKGYLAMLLRDWGRLPEAEQREFLHIALEETDRLAELVDRLLDMSCLQAGRLRIEPVPLDLGQLVADTVRRLQPLLAGARLELTLEPGLPPVLADERRIGQVLRNLLENAARYSPPGAPITVTVRASGPLVEVAVADRGPGIPPETLARLFTPFYRGEEHEARGDRRRGGLGLGLAIARGLVEAHGGRIWAESQVGAGSRFCFVLPALGRGTRRKRARGG